MISPFLVSCTSNVLTKQSPLETSCSQELDKKFPEFYRTRRFVRMISTAHHWSLWVNSSLKIHIISILPSLPMYSSKLLTLQFPDQSFVYIYLPPQATCPRLSHPPNKVWRTAQLTKFLVKQIFPPRCLL